MKNRLEEARRLLHLISKSDLEYEVDDEILTDIKIWLDNYMPVSCDDCDEIARLLTVLQCRDMRIEKLNKRIEELRAMLDELGE